MSNFVLKGELSESLGFPDVVRETPQEIAELAEGKVVRVT